GHNAGATDAGRIVDSRVGEAVRLQLLDTLVGDVEHLVLRTKLQAARRTGLHAGRLQADRHAIRAHRALVDPVGLLAELRHIEWTAGHAVAAPDALVLLEIHDAVCVLHDGARRWTGDEAAWLGAVHALVLPHQPVQPAFVLVLAEPDQIPEARR